MLILLIFLIKHFSSYPVFTYRLHAYIHRTEQRPEKAGICGVIFCDVSREVVKSAT